MQIWNSIKKIFSRPEPLKLDLQQTTSRQEWAKPANSIQRPHPFQVPELTQEDVERIVRRDFPPNMFDSIINLLGSYGDKRGQPEAPRVRLAVLNLANGDYTKINVYLDLAKYDFREVLSKVEYPIPYEWLHRGPQ